MGKGSSSADRAAASAQRDQTALAKQLINEAGPTRGALFDQANQFLGSELGVTDEFFSSPQFRASKASLDAQAQRARDSIISSTPEGGGLTEALANLDTSVALGEAQAAGAIAEGNLNRATQMATFGTAQGSQTMGMAGQTAASLAAAEAQENAGKSAGLGTAAGLTMAAMKMPAPVPV